MSLRDEMVRKAQDAYCRGASPEGIAEALMLLVERAVREGALQMAGLCVAEFAPTIEMPSTMLIERADAIVARVTGKGGL